MDNNHKIAIEFLLWSYFGLTEEDKKETIIERCIRLAYSDATNQGAYNTRKKESIKYSPKFISDCIGNLRGNSDYDKWHEQSCKKIVNQFGDEKFTYGNAQKWLNMTVKYLFIVNSIIEMLDADASKGFQEFYNEKFKNHEESFHVPIDSYIIESLWEENEKTENAQIWLSGAKGIKNGTLGAYSTEKYKVWSKFEGGDYRKISDYIKKNKIKESGSPMEWENENWIKVAKARRDNKIKKDK